MDKEDKIKLLEEENEILKEKLKNYTAPKRSKKFYENHKEEIKQKVREYKEKIRARGGVKTDDETCPHCGAMTDAEYPNKYYGCGTHINDPTHRFGTCYERQLAAKDAEIEGLKIEWSDKLVTAVLNEREACAKLCDAYKNPNDPYEPVSQFNSGAYTTAEALADEIRARGEVK